MLAAAVYFSWGSSHAITVHDAINAALQTHPDIRVQTTELLAREKEIEQAESGYRPNVDVTGGYGWEWNDNSSTASAGFDEGRDLMRKEVGVQMTQMLFDGYATDSEVARQKARYASTSHRIDGLSQGIALDAIDAYLKVLRHRELLVLSEANLRSHQRVYSQIDLRLEAGVGSRVDLEQVEGRRALANTSRLSDVVNLKDVETTYLDVVGQLAVADMTPVDSVASALPRSLQEAMQVAFAEHPTLKSAEADIRAAKAQHEAARQNDYPKFNFEVGGNWRDNQNGVEGEERDLRAMVMMRYNLYSGGRDSSRKEQTAHLLSESKEVRNQTFRQVVESLRLSWAAYQATRSQLGSLRDYVRATTETRKAYGKQFRIGKRTLVDVLNVEAELFEAKRSLVEAKYDNLFAEYRILAGMGRLIEQLQTTAPRGEGRGDEELESYGQLAAAELTLSAFDPTFPRRDGSAAAQPGTSQAAQVEGQIMAWAKAWEAGNIEDYLSFYSSSFSSPKYSSRAAWEESRRRIISRAKDISIEIFDLTVRIDGDSGKANFTQRYAAHNYRDEVKKSLELRNEDGVWKIVAERVR
jgi:adhesin transport system outer membrane protein